MNSNELTVEKTHNRSNALHIILMQEIYLFKHESSFRNTLTKCLSGISFEHSNSLMILMATNNYTTAVSLLRLQYEAATRGMWLHFAAKESFLDKYAAPIDVKKLPPDFPAITEMIDQITKGSVKGTGEMLKHFKDVTWSGMNSFVHNGFLPIERFLNGYPHELLVQIMQSSNALNIMVAMVLARMSGDMDKVNLVKHLQVDFQDCLPKLEPISPS